MSEFGQHQQPGRGTQASAQRSRQEADQLQQLYERLAVLESAVFRDPESVVGGEARDRREGRASRIDASSLLSGPAHVAACLIRAEAEVALADDARMALDLDLERLAERRAASSLATGVLVALDGLVLPDEVLPLPVIDDFLKDRGGQGRLDLEAESSTASVDINGFRNMELAVLHMTGLSREAASAHVDRSLAMYRSHPKTFRSLSDVERTLERVEDRLTQLTEEVRAQGNAPKSSRRRRLRRCITALGGVLIVVANTAATPLITPVGALASATLGGGAAGAAAGVFDDL